MAHDNETNPFEFSGDWLSPVISTVVHSGHGLRPSLRGRIVLAEADRFREEDPYTDAIAAGLPALTVMKTSRFEVDLNRPRDKAIYRTPADCWDLEVWDGGVLDDASVAESLVLYDEFYEALGKRLDSLAQRGPFVVYDVHSYNHRREGPDGQPQPQEETPDVNVGTASVDRDRWGTVIDTFMESMAQQPVRGGTLDVRENVRFRGANVVSWINEHYGHTGCALALEFKKTFMDEWTGEVDHAHVGELRDALAATVAPVTGSFEELAWLRSAGKS